MTRPSSRPDWPVGFSVDPDDFVINITYPIGFTGDDEHLLMTSAAGTDTARLVVVDPNGGRLVREVAEDPDYDLYGISVPGLRPIVRHPDTREPQIVTWLKDRAEYRVLDPAIADDFERVRAAAQGDVSIESRDDEGEVWLVRDGIDRGLGPLSRLRPSER